MTKSQLVDRLAERLPQLPRRAVEQMVNVVFDGMASALLREERIEIRGFGTFCVRLREPHAARNPKTGQPVKVPRRRQLHFTPGKELRERLHQSDASGAASAKTGEVRAGGRAQAAEETGAGRAAAG